MSLLYIAAGINHFLHPQWYMQIMPSYLPWHSALVNISGYIEIIAGVLLLVNPVRRIAAWCIIVLLVLVFPANIQMMLNYFHEQNRYLWLTILRLPVQFLLIWWAYKFT